MIVVKFQGRLGNQIFQYVFAMSISKKLRTCFLIDCLPDSTFFKYFESKSISRFKFINDFLLKLFGKIHKIKIHQKGVDYVNEVQKQFVNAAYYDGFFQSEFFFENIKNTVRQRLIIRKEYRAIFMKKYGQLFNNNKIIAIHCRLGDYLNWGSDELGGENLTLPKYYYINSLKKIDQIENYKIIIVTDDIESIKDKFDFIQNKIIISDEEIVDFQILQNAHQLIVSNSSFSWWGAYLNNKSATVYAPEYWLGFKVKNEYPNSIIPKSWIKINCYEE